MRATGDVLAAVRKVFGDAMRRSVVLVAGGLGALLLAPVGAWAFAADAGSPTRSRLVVTALVLQGQLPS